MNRRGHLSNKIPNVKLRPVPSAPSTRTRNNARSPSPLTGMDAVINQREMEGEEDEEVSSAALRNVERPWKGVVITFTGVEQKIRLAGLAGELGAKVESALTVNVTHVVAGAFGSDKYHYAVEHRLPVLTPEWIEENHGLWLSGGDVEGSIEPYRLRPFTGLTISISGIEQLDRRKQILGAVKQFGGTYLKDLDRSCTHLVIPKPASELKSSAKVKFVLDDIRERDLSRRRGKKVQGHEMRLVYEEWIWDCIGFNGRFKEDDYDARKPKKEGKVKAEDVLSGDVLMDEEAVLKKEPKEEDGPAVIRKRKREDIDSLVGNLISTTMAKVEAGSDGDITPSRPSRRGTASSELRKSSLLHATRTASFGPSKPNLDPMPTASMPATAPQPPTAEMLGGKPGAPPIFAGLRIGHLIDEAYGGLERAIVAHGATLVTEEQRLQGDQVDYVIVRLAAPRHPTPVDGQSTPTIVTECWIEGCCFEQALLPIDAHIVFRPLPAPMPIGGTSGFTIHLSGISAEGNTYLRRLIRVIGASQAISLNRQTTHLVSGRKDGPKVDKAREWGIKVVSEAWLFAMGKSGHVEPESDYPVDSISTATVTGDEEKAVKSASSAVSQSQSQARALKPTPTHVDDHPADSSVSGSTTAFNSASNSNLALDIPSGSATPLSPPEGPSASARMLNQASLPDSRNFSGSSLDREEMSSKPKPPVQESIGTSGRNREMTDVLRQLAEKGDTSSSRIKAPRRSKGALRARTSITLAQRNTTSISPDKQRDRDSSPPPPDGEYDHLISAQPVYDESMRVSIADPAAERERKKMMDALRKTSQLGSGSRVGR